MLSFKKKITCLFIAILAIANAFAQTYQPKTVASNGYSYTTVSNDPMKTRIYKLQNGLSVFLSVYKNAPRIQTYIAVKAGSKNDPTSLTGLAHYLEHIVFKGTSKLGTADWANEKTQLDKIEALYETYRNTKDEKKRNRLYALIDSTSGVAATYAIANEYDKIVSGIGAQGTNAYTWVEQTVYVNDIPANEIDRWAKVEAERFGELTPRLFHTELEAVYEEKNRGLDNDMSKVIETTFAAMFPHHPYGSQTTIGTVEHLKNPSITAIKNYFYTYYVPNNMAICLSGDFNPDEVIKIIDKYWGAKKAKAVPAFNSYQEMPISSPISKTIVGPSPASVTLCYRFPGAASKDVRIMEMFSKVLSNGKAGVLDLNLIQKQKVLNASVFPYSMKDYSVNIIFANPRQGQTLDEVKNLVLAQIDSVKLGKFDAELLQAIVNNEKISLMKQMESNESRADMLVDAFIKGINWADYLTALEEMGKVSKQNVVAFANKYYGDNYAVVYKTTGKDTTIEKVPKPKITPVSVNREKESLFLQQVMQAKPANIEPVFIDYAKDLQKLKLKGNIDLNYKKNDENSLFELNYVFDMGNENDAKVGLAMTYLDYLGTSKLTPEQIKTEFYKLGCTYNISVGSDRMSVALSGLSENFDRALVLLESLLADPKADDEALQRLIEGILKQRTDAKLDKATILRAAMVSYAKYGLLSPFTNILSESELKRITSAKLIAIIKQMLSYQHRILYYGPFDGKVLLSSLDKYHKTTKNLLQIPAKKLFKELEFTENEVYWVDYDMVQAEMLFLTKSVKYDAKLVPQSALYNEYFGGGMGSLVFQEIRESKALAYAASSRYSVAKDIELSNYNVSYIGTQADKLPEAMAAISILIDSIPQSATLFATAKESILNNVRTDRITKAAVLANYENAMKMGLSTDIRIDIFEKVQKADYTSVQSFHNQYAKSKVRKVLVIGAKDKLNFATLAKYGKLKQLTLTEIFGY